MGSGRQEEAKTLKQQLSGGWPGSSGIDDGHVLEKGRWSSDNTQSEMTHAQQKHVSAKLS